MAICTNRRSCSKTADIFEPVLAHPLHFREKKMAWCVWSPRVQASRHTLQFCSKVDRGVADRRLAHAVDFSPTIQLDCTMRLEDSVMILRMLGKMDFVGDRSRFHLKLKEPAMLCHTFFWAKARMEWYPLSEYPGFVPIFKTVPAAALRHLLVLGTDFLDNSS